VVAVVLGLLAGADHELVPDAQTLQVVGRQGVWVGQSAAVAFADADAGDGPIDPWVQVPVSLIAASDRNQGGSV
jgi:hypothetical protein